MALGGKWLQFSPRSCARRDPSAARGIRERRCVVAGGFSCPFLAPPSPLGSAREEERREEAAAPALRAATEPAARAAAAAPAPFPAFGLSLIAGWPQDGLPFPMGRSQPGISRHRPDSSLFSALHRGRASARSPKPLADGNSLSCLPLCLPREARPGSLSRGACCVSLSPKQATKQFLEEINKWTGQYNVSPLSWNVAVKFLMARKFDVLRAIELFHCYRETRLREGIVKLKPHEEPLRSELLSGKFTILSVRDPSGASIALFTAKLHHPSKSVQHVVLQALFYLLDRAVESFETQRNGLVFIYDMAGSQYTNFELDLSKKILNLLKGAFPARLKKVFIVGAPMWFRVPYSIISLLLKEKLRERVQMVKMSELKEHLPRECLPEYLGGSLKLVPLSWNCRFLPQQNGHPDPLDELILVPLAPPKDNGSVHVPGPKSITVQELLDHVTHKQKRGIYEEYEDIRRRSPAGTFVCSLAPHNQEKNRYGDVPCLDQTRVKLAKPYSRPELTDYINASFMDGYKQRNAYIGTQGPLENTYGDFWRMVWEQNVLVIVMTTRLEEGGRRKCGQYWPLEKDFQVRYGALTITNLGVENLNHYKKTVLELHSSESRERRLVSHFQYLSWPDYGVPSSAATLIDFLGAVKQQQRVAASALGPRFKGHPGGPPVVVHCSAGIGRTGTQPRSGDAEAWPDSPAYFRPNPFNVKL
ncbi:PREDICTED: tyrosine-protein phosphatase non-receptor type 9 [Tinamus guttatus]|uniref:tyrosine-protein phosphatase non-receptor type 9 n=1 Tax=Tinamus guttatus TaxID=94827 RepID=UPI00052EBFAA|nr:PREDICTED: tyrosine-protein phosphatase non-receptor type 9 [Tinamus guttatus]